MKKEDKTSGPFFRNLFTGFAIGTCFIISVSALASDISSDKNSPNFTPEANPFSNSLYQLRTDLKHISINSVTQLKHELRNANKNKGYVSLDIEDGVYQLDRTLDIRADYIALNSKSGHPENVIIQGSKLKNAGVPVLIKVFANHFSIDGITLQNAKAHLIQIAGEHNADYPVIRNCILQDSYQQLVKISYDKKKRAGVSADFGLIENSIFQYTDGIGPNFYIGGIDLHAGNSWIIRNNKFKDIASPGGSIAEHAIHAWNNAYNTMVEHNVIEDCDRAIGLGLFTRKRHPSIVFSHRGGVIRNNLVLHKNNNDPFADVGIILEGSADTLIESNRIWLEHNYPNAIEYRFQSTQNVIIKNNISNKAIVSRNGGKAKLSNNKTNAKLGDVLEGNL